jgi:hypothetical protein
VDEIVWCEVTSVKAGSRRKIFAIKCDACDEYRYEVTEQRAFGLMKKGQQKSNPRRTIGKYL